VLQIQAAGLFDSHRLGILRNLDFFFLFFLIAFIIVVFRHCEEAADAGESLLVDFQADQQQRGDDHQRDHQHDGADAVKRQRGAGEQSGADDAAVGVGIGRGREIRRHILDVIGQDAPAFQLRRRLQGAAQLQGDQQQDDRERILGIRVAGTAVDHDDDDLDDDDADHNIEKLAEQEASQIVQERPRQAEPHVCDDGQGAQDHDRDPLAEFFVLGRFGSGLSLACFLLRHCFPSVSYSPVLISTMAGRIIGRLPVSFMT